MLTTCLALLFLAGSLAAQEAPGASAAAAGEVRPALHRTLAFLANIHSERRLAEAQCAGIEMRLALFLGGQPD